jgi:hypothetical protein
MKSSLSSTVVALVALLVVSHVEAAETERGTLTLRSDKIVFQTRSKEFVYPLGQIGSEIPGMKIVKFEPKSLERDGKEIDISEITLENQSNGDKFLLVQATPVDFIRTTDGSKTTWMLDTK